MSPTLNYGALGVLMRQRREEIGLSLNEFGLASRTLRGFVRDIEERGEGPNHLDVGLLARWAQVLKVPTSQLVATLLCEN